MADEAASIQMRARPASKRTERRAMAGLLSVGVALVVGARLNGGVSLDSFRPNLAGGGGSMAPGSKYTASLTYEDFLEFSTVKKFLETVGVAKSDWSDYSKLEGYLPREVTVELAASKVQGSLGVDAEDGLVFTAITYLSDNAFTASYLLVMDLRGTLVQVSPLYGESMIDAGFESSKDFHKTIFQALGLKMFNKTHVLLALGAGGTDGPRALWDWRSDAWTTLCDGATNDAHDIQWAYETAAIWQADGTTKVEEADAASGAILAHFAEEKVQDPNHVQATEEDAYFYISSRQTDSIIKMSASGDVEWTLGGEYGDYRIEDYDGTTYAAGSTVWSGQHNAEYFGDDEYCMFDNQERDKGHLYSESRMLCVKLEDDGSTKKGVVTFNYFMGAYTPHFGDNDRLATGNMLGIHWPDVVDYDDQYDVRAVEVVRDTGDLAWEMKVVGTKCDTRKGCDHTAGGWYAYSAERVYETPIVYNVACSDATVTFDAVNTFKQMNKVEGTYTISPVADDDDGAALAGTFDFPAHWRPASVSVAVPASTSRAQITVTNQYGETQTVYAAGC